MKSMCTCLLYCFLDRSFFLLSFHVRSCMSVRAKLYECVRVFFLRTFEGSLKGEASAG